MLLTLGLATPAFAQSDCESRCMDDYGRTRYPSDQNLCMRSSAPGRCLDETRANARNYCRDRCNANWQGAAEKTGAGGQSERHPIAQYGRPDAAAAGFCYGAPRLIVFGMRRHRPEITAPGRRLPPFKFLACKTFTFGS